MAAETMRHRAWLVIAAVVVAIVLLTVTRRAPAPTPGPVSRPVAPSAGFGAPLPAHPSKIAALSAEIAPDAVSPIANSLNAPGGTIQQDLEILNAVFVAWQTNFPREGNPVGENDEITAALAGDNRLHYAFVAPASAAINSAGQLCDRWGIAFRFHQLSGTRMEIRSAGPDRKFGTADDVQFAPGRNTH